MQIQPKFKMAESTPGISTFSQPYLSNYCLDTAQWNTLIIGTDNKLK